jgi:hypothetical protein
MPSLRVYRASDEFARELFGRIARWVMLGVGGSIMVVGLLMELLPSHMLGMPFLVIGLMIVLRNSIKARRRFVRMQQSHPNFVFPIRRLMRREPEVFPVVWQQLLRMERVVLPRRVRFFKATRRRLMGRSALRPAASALVD